MNERGHGACIRAAEQAVQGAYENAVDLMYEATVAELMWVNSDEEHGARIAAAVEAFDRLTEELTARDEFRAAMLSEVAALQIMSNSPSLDLRACYNEYMQDMQSESSASGFTFSHMM